jgi:hypothetical protein
VTCPLCGASERLGIRLPRLKAEIFDRIRQAGDLGISSTKIVSSDLYFDRRPVMPATIKAHVFQLNDLLAATDFRIRSGGGRWFLTRGAR